MITTVAITLSLSGFYDDGSFRPDRAYLYLTILDNISITVSMYYLVLFYQATKEELAPFTPIPKFLCIKSIIFFSFWQGVAIAVLAYFGAFHNVGTWSSEEIATGLQDFMVCIEMFFISIIHVYVFPYHPFHNPNKKPFVRAILRGDIKGSLDPFSEAVLDQLNPRHDLKVTLETFSHAKEEVTPLILKGRRTVDLP